MARELTPGEKEVARKLNNAWIKKKRSDKSLSQEKLAEKLNLNQSGVSQYLTGSRAIGLELLIKFCLELDLEVVEVYPAALIKGDAEETARALEFLSLFVRADDGVKEGVLSILRSSPLKQ